MSRHNAKITQNNLPEITDAQIKALRSEAASAGDTIQVEYCDDALRGDDDARSECARVIRDAAAME